jgi:hypothetical protein
LTAQATEVFRLELTAIPIDFLRLLAHIQGAKVPIETSNIQKAMLAAPPGASW